MDKATQTKGPPYKVEQKNPIKFLDNHKSRIIRMAIREKEEDKQFNQIKKE